MCVCMCEKERGDDDTSLHKSERLGDRRKKIRAS